MNEQDFLDAVSQLIFNETGVEVFFTSLDEMDQWFFENKEIDDQIGSRIDQLELSDEAFYGQGQVPAISQIHRETSLSGEFSPQMEPYIAEEYERLENETPRDLMLDTLELAAFLPFTPGSVAKGVAWASRTFNAISRTAFGRRVGAAGINVANNLRGYVGLLNPANLKNLWSFAIRTPRWIRTGSRIKGEGAFSWGSFAGRLGATGAGVAAGTAGYNWLDQQLGGALPNFGWLGHEEGESGQLTPEEQAKRDNEVLKAQERLDREIAEAASSYHIQNNTTFSQDAVNFANWFVDNESGFMPSDFFIDGQPVMDVTKLQQAMGFGWKSLNDTTPGGFRDQWETHWRQNWGTDPIYKDVIVRHLLDVVAEEYGSSFRVMGPNGEELTPDDGEAYLAQIIGQGGTIPEPHIAEAVSNFTDELITQGISKVLATPKEGIDPETGDPTTGTAYTLTGYSHLPDISDGSIFDLTSNGRVHSLNVDSQLKVIAAEDPVLFEQVKRQLDAYGFFPEGVNARNANIEHVQNAYTRLHNTLLQIHAEHLETYIDRENEFMPLKQSEVRNEIVKRQISPTQQINIDTRRDAEEQQLISDVNFRVQNELQNKGYRMSADVLTSIDSAVTSAIKKDSGARKAGSTYERDLATALLKEFHGPNGTPTFGPVETPAAGVIQASKYGHLNPEIRSLVNGGGSVYQAWKGIRDEDFMETAVDNFISYLPTNGEPMNYADFYDAFNTYLWVNGGTRGASMTADDIDTMANNVWRSVQEKDTETDDYTRRVVQGMGMRDYGSPEMWEAFELMNQAGRGGRAITRSRV